MPTEVTPTGARDDWTVRAFVRWRVTPWWGKVLLVYAVTRVVTGLLLAAFAVVQAQPWLGAEGARTVIGKLLGGDLRHGSSG